MLNLFLRLFSTLGLAALIAVALMLPLAGLTYADDPLVVNSTGDDGDFAPGDGTCETGNGNGICTLRAAIQESNTNPTITHTISFSITGAGPHTISPGFALPDITHPVTIDGLTEPGASCTSWPPTLLIEIDGTNVPAVINSISPPDVTPPIGLSVISGTSTIRGLVINNFKKSVIVVGNIGTGVAVNNSDNNVIECNFLGTETNGTTPAANQFGIALGNADNNLITNNLISGNGDGGGGGQDAGISIGIEPDSAGNSKNNQIIGNYIGTVVTGTAALPNGEDGILLINSQNTTISGNLISGNGDDGVDITDVDSVTVSIFTFSLACDAPPCATGNVIKNNTIGLDINGGALGNGNSGIEIKNAEQNRIYSNTITNNAYQGVEINELTASEDACTKGSTPCTVSNTITANSIFANTELGIDLTANSTGGVTPNDSGPNGANRLQNYPVLSAALTSTTSLYVSGALTSTANSNFTVELFANDSCDASDYGEGKTFLISDTVTTNGSGSITFQITSVLPNASYITASATDLGGNTSEFSTCLPISRDSAQRSVYLPAITKDI